MTTEWTAKKVRDTFIEYFQAEGHTFKEAIEFAWNLLTKVYGLDAARLYVTYFEGSAKDGLPVDSEARQCWLDLGLPESRVLPFGPKENFWEMGEQGPCGPCSEIHYDRIGGGRDAGALVNLDDPDVLEIWNLVFMEFNREADGSLRGLPHKHIDTGMGMERLVSALQDKPSNYDTDVFAPLFAAIQQLTGARPYTGRVGAADADGVDMAYRVVADHVRTLSFAIADGGQPSNEGRGYVLRRILRRGARYARRKFGAELGGFFARLVDTVAETMGDAFPEVRSKAGRIKEVLSDEERAFARTLDRGERLFEQTVAALPAGELVLPGRQVWRLYDTYGFPVDLTQILAEERGLRVDMAAFAAEAELARAESRRSKAPARAAAIALDVHMLAALGARRVARTDDAAKFGGAPAAGCRVLALVDASGLVERVGAAGAAVGVVLDRTCFYAEQGGQEYDTGALVSVDDDAAEVGVEDVQAFGGYVLHRGVLAGGALAVGDLVDAQIDQDRRAAIRSNHTATHAVNYALRRAVGPAADQRGSLVAPDRLRFDYAFGRALTPLEVRDVEAQCERMIADALPVSTLEMPRDHALAISGLRAVFGESYPDVVRVVAVGADLAQVSADPADPRWAEFSIELCGGTHVASTAEIRRLVVTEESAIAKGVRRLVAVTGEAAEAAQRLQLRLKAEIEAAGSNEAEIKRLAKELDTAAIG
ncbi:Alanine--tRNA ligase, partial [Coemansia aciculifera]